MCKGANGLVHRSKPLQKNPEVSVMHIFFSYFILKDQRILLPIFPLVARIQKTTYESIFNKCSNICGFFLRTISLSDGIETPKFTIAVFLKEHPWHILWQKLLALGKIPSQAILLYLFILLPQFQVSFFLLSSLKQCDIPVNV